MKAVSCVFYPRITLNYAATNFISKFERECETLKEHVSKVKIVGCIFGKENNTDDAMRVLSLTQYVLVPVIIDTSLNHEIIVGNFYKFTKEQKIIRNEDLKLIRDFGNGLVLYRRVNK